MECGKKGGGLNGVSAIVHLEIHNTNKRRNPTARFPISGRDNLVAADEQIVGVTCGKRGGIWKGFLP